MLADQTPAQNRFLRINIAKIAEQLNNLLGLPAGSVLVPVDPLPPEWPVHSAQEAAAKACESLRLANEMAAARREAASGLKDPAALQDAQTSAAKAELESMQAEIAYRVANATLKGTICAE